MERVSCTIYLQTFRIFISHVYKRLSRASSWYNLYTAKWKQTYHCWCNEYCTVHSSSIFFLKFTEKFDFIFNILWKPIIKQKRNTKGPHKGMLITGVSHKECVYKVYGRFLTTGTKERRKYFSTRMHKI